VSLEQLAVDDRRTSGSALNVRLSCKTSNIFLEILLSCSLTAKWNFLTRPSVAGRTRCASYPRACPPYRVPLSTSAVGRLLASTAIREPVPFTAELIDESGKTVMRWPPLG
jgi:hypothetical protein